MMHGKGLAFAGVCLRAWRRLCTQETGWPAEKAALEQALRVAQTSKDTEVRRVEKLQWEARLEAQVRTARAAPRRTAPHRTQGSARKAAHRPRPRAPARTCTGRNLYATCTHRAPCRALRTLPRPPHPAAPFAPCRALRTLPRPPHPRARRRTLEQARIAELEHALRQRELEGRDGTRHAELHAEERRRAHATRSTAHATAITEHTRRRSAGGSEPAASACRALHARTPERTRRTS
jgi:hypothetical protein